MTRRREISLVFEKLLWERPSSPDALATGPDAPLDVTVLFTNTPGTMSALEKATELAHNLNARIRLLVPQVVPYPAPLTSPPILLEFNERRFREIASRQSVETRVEICLCRDVEDVFGQRLKPDSVVVIGARDCWWPTGEKALARKLRRSGHHVVVAHRPNT